MKSETVMILSSTDVTRGRPFFRMNFPVRGVSNAITAATKYAFLRGGIKCEGAAAEDLPYNLVTQSNEAPIVPQLSKGVRSCSKPRRRLPMKPRTNRSESRVCRRCQKLCTPMGVKFYPGYSGNGSEHHFFDARLVSRGHRDCFAVAT